MRRLCYVRVLAVGTVREAILQLSEESYFFSLPRRAVMVVSVSL